MRQPARCEQSDAPLRGETLNSHMQRATQLNAAFRSDGIGWVIGVDQHGNHGNGTTRQIRPVNIRERVPLILIGPNLPYGANIEPGIDELFYDMQSQWRI